MDNRFSRIEKLIGPASLAHLAGSSVTVVGTGAVGSYVVEGLARAGVGHLRLVDFDRVSIGNINRQLFALDSTVGRLKVEVARQRVLDINPRCQVEVFPVFVDQDTVGDILESSCDLLVDAIDSLGPKVELLARSWQAGLPLISCMGAALRTDPAQIRVADMMATRKCPLARRVRKKLRQLGVGEGIECVYSLEDVNFDYGAHDPDGELPQDHGLDRGRRRRVLGSLPTLTGIFGLVAANLAIARLSDGQEPGEDRGQRPLSGPGPGGSR